MVFVKELALLIWDYLGYPHKELVPALLQFFVTDDIRSHRLAWGTKERIIATLNDLSLTYQLGYHITGNSYRDYQLQYTKLNFLCFDVVNQLILHATLVNQVNAVNKILKTHNYKYTLKVSKQKELALFKRSVVNNAN